MESIAFFNNKGGVGKTTLLCNVAAFLALERNKKVLVIDADPQCNATQLMLDELEVIDLYDDSSSFTIHSVIHPLSIGRGYSNTLSPVRIANYGLDLIPGDPRLALKEDLLSKDWQDATSGDIRGLRTSYLFAQLLSRCENYDYVLFDMGPSLGSINRAVLLACDYFVSPMSIDIFSLKAIENISTAILEWKRRLKLGVSQVPSDQLDDLPNSDGFDIKFAGYVAQQYVQKTRSGEKRVVAAYESILKKIPKTIKANFVDKFKTDDTAIKYEIGRIPNLYSLIPMSQSARKPVFQLKAKDGVRGAHFNKVKDAEDIFRNVTDQLVRNVDELSL
ncbi:AAA family ATPase [uncultured Brevundimonas sp.]|uniref:ParA family protein n=1 Tax=uncultured Brevundimonas sp. TaxID=213418 RepID=UPI0025FA5C98|nr:AAA family ATPase [uncultured Brevundimonas sp.]